MKRGERKGRRISQWVVTRLYASRLKKRGNLSYLSVKREIVMGREVG